MEKEEIILTPESVQAEIKRTRHKKEVPLYVLLSILGLLTAGIITLLKSESTFVEIVRALIEESGIGTEGVDIKALTMLLTVIAVMLSGIGMVIFLLVSAFVALYRYYAVELAYGIRVSENNYPEIYEKVKEYTYLLGLKKEPEVFVRQENGAVNAFTCWIPNRAFIQLNAEIVDLAYLENKDWDTVYFVMAHEFGHYYLHHVQIGYTIWPILVTLIPVLGPNFLLPLLSRSREYSADRVAQALTNGVAQENCMKLLSAGRHGYKYVDTESYLKEISRNPGRTAALARWIINMLASHPIAPFRTAAILDPEKKSGRLL